MAYQMDETKGHRTGFMNMGAIFAYVCCAFMMVYRLIVHMVNHAGIHQMWPKCQLQAYVIFHMFESSFNE